MDHHDTAQRLSRTGSMLSRCPLCLCTVLTTGQRMRGGCSNLFLSGLAPLPFGGSPPPPFADEKLGRLVLLLQSFSPTANLLVVVCHWVGQTRSAELVAQALVFQYLLGLVTFTVAVSIALGLVYG
eukprot:m.271729 g.271729  ORF g.271729 m.271729 type:complete len:126 (+) comp19325_c0_seq7:249-626(+)